MAEWDDDFTTPGTSASVDLILEVNVAEQDIPGNRSRVTWQYRMVKGSAGFPFRASNDCVAEAHVDGRVHRATNLNYNFPSGPHTVVVASGAKWINHNADGTKQISCSASYNGHHPIGTASISAKTLTLPTIPRNRARVGRLGVWQLCETFAGINGQWRPVRLYAGVSGTWKETQP